jgi:uncharacterized DUF497 family protein
MNFRFNKEKNDLLIKTRNISFEEIVFQIEQGNVLDLIVHTNRNKYPDQDIMIVRVIDKDYFVPFITEEDGTLFLKTLYTSRKATKKYLHQNLLKMESSHKKGLVSQ